MKKASIALAVVTLVFLAQAVPAQAGGEASLYWGRSSVDQFFLPSMNTFGGTVGAFADFVGFELGIEYSPIASFEVGPIGLGASLLNVMGNLVVQVPAGRVVPYGTIGYGAFIGRANLDVGGVVNEDFLGTLGALNYGFGAKVFFTDHVGARVDWRRFSVQTDAAPDLTIPLTNTRIDTTPDLNRLVVGAAFRF
jgi:hypothetical protein